MYRDLQKNGQPVPASPTKIPDEWRRRYPIKVTLAQRESASPISGTNESRHVIVVEDCGIGMDEESISKYLLQVGRSFYTTKKFRREYPFVPTSRFGLGFLSVFAVSDRVEVETYNPDTGSAPLRLELAGPRNYLLIESSDRRERGTRVSVELDTKFARGMFIYLVRDWCKRVEFPIEVNELNLQGPLEREKFGEFEQQFDVSEICEDAIRFEIRAIPFDKDHVEGELYVFVKVDRDEIERWDVEFYALPERIRRDPRLAKLHLPGTLVCLNGIRTGNTQYGSGSNEVRMDIRGGSFITPALSRNQSVRPMDLEPVRAAWTEALGAHLDKVSRQDVDGLWRYCQRLIDKFPIDDFNEFWRDQEATFPLITTPDQSQRQAFSLSNVLKKPSIWILKGKGDCQSRHGRFPYIGDWEVLSRDFKQVFLSERNVVRIEKDESGSVWFESVCAEMTGGIEPQYEPFNPFNRIEMCKASDADVIGAVLDTGHIYINSDHRLVAWFRILEKVSSDYGNDAHAEVRAISESLVELIAASDWKELYDRMKLWSLLDTIPEAYRPPHVEITYQSIW
jgi:hypothetical protein